MCISDWSSVVCSSDLLDIEHRTGFRIGIDLEHDQPQRDAHRRGIGDAALAAFVGVELGRLKLVMHEIKLGGAGEIADREDAAQRLFEARHLADRRVADRQRGVSGKSGSVRVALGGRPSYKTKK